MRRQISGWLPDRETFSRKIGDFVLSNIFQGYYGRRRQSTIDHVTIHLKFAAQTGK
jgi:hypothetical protein